jgi:hypothetical protein
LDAIREFPITWNFHCYSVLSLSTYLCELLAIAQFPFVYRTLTTYFLRCFLLPWNRPGAVAHHGVMLQLRKLVLNKLFKALWINKRKRRSGYDQSTLYAHLEMSQSNPFVQVIYTNKHFLTVLGFELGVLALARQSVTLSLELQPQCYTNKLLMYLIKVHDKGFLFCGTTDSWINYLN